MKIERIDNPSASEDFAEHERTFAFFVRMAAIAGLHVASCLVAVAIGGLLDRWYLALFIFVVATVAAAMGVASENLGWRPGAAILALSLVTFAVTA